MDNDANEVAIKVRFDENDPNLKLKEDMMLEKIDYK